MHISSYSPSMDEWQVVVAHRSAPSSCAYRNSLSRRSMQNSPTVLSKSLLVPYAHFFETPSADPRVIRGSAYPAFCTGNLSTKQEGAHCASYED